MRKIYLCKLFSVCERTSESRALVWVSEDREGKSQFEFVEPGRRRLAARAVGLMESSLDLGVYLSLYLYDVYERVQIPIDMNVT